jgi:hypothetical protein
MKIGVILLLVAGPCVVRGQFSHDQGPGSPGFGWKPAAITLYPLNSVRILMPDRMPCLLSLGVMDRMPIDRRRNPDPMPNGVRQRVKIDSSGR